MKKVLLILCALISVTGVANVKAIQYTNPSKSIMVSKKSPVVTITLRSNGTTGYLWFLRSITPSLARPMSHKYVAPNTKLIGAPGHEVWKFMVNSSSFTVPRVIDIKLTYARPWQVQDGKTTTFYVVTEQS
jgi:inhibitor of cysteine peptidase